MKLPLAYHVCFPEAHGKDLVGNRITDQKASNGSLSFTKVVFGVPMRIFTTSQPSIKIWHQFYFSTSFSDTAFRLYTANLGIGICPFFPRVLPGLF